MWAKVCGLLKFAELTDLYRDGDLEAVSAKSGCQCGTASPMVSCHFSGTRRVAINLQSAYEKGR